jgi:hypothetical protein
MPQLAFRSQGQVARLLLLATFVLLMAFASGCGGGPKLVNAWQDPEYQGPKFRNVVVVGITEKQTSRRIFEDVFSQRLRERGLNAAASYAELNENRKYEREEIEALIRERGFDAIITARVVGVDRQTSHTGGYATVYPGTAYYGDFYGFYDYSWGVYTSPGHTYSYDVVRIESNVYETSDWDLVWTGQTETVDPGEVEKESIRLADLIIGELETRGLL